MKSLLIILLAGFLLIACESETELKAHDPWMRATVQGENAAVYFVLHDHANQDDELIGTTTNVADTAEFHFTTVESDTDIMHMDRVLSVPIPANSEVIFAPGKYHLMLAGLKKDPRVGDHIGVILHFKNHEDIILNVSVQDAAPEEDHSL